MTVYKKQETDGNVQYLDVQKKKFVEEKDINPAVLEELKLAPVGEEVDSETITNDTSAQLGAPNGDPIAPVDPSTIDTNKPKTPEAAAPDAAIADEKLAQDGADKEEEAAKAGAIAPGDSPAKLDSDQPEAEDEEEEAVVEPAGKYKAPNHTPKLNIPGGLDDGKSAAKDTNPYRQAPQSSTKGFGWPRRNGKTVDIFDLTTPHSQVKVVGEFIVPLSEESFKNKDEAEIYDRLVELGYVS